MCAFSLFSLFSRAEAARKFGIDDYLALNDISEINLSPQGRFIAYTVSSNDFEKDEQRDVVWMISTDCGEPVRMSAVESSASSPKWSPDGKFLAILSDRKEETSHLK